MPKTRKAPPASGASSPSRTWQDVFHYALDYRLRFPTAKDGYARFLAQLKQDADEITLHAWRMAVTYPTLLASDPSLLQRIANIEFPASFLSPATDVLHFTPDLIPEPIRAWLVDESERIPVSLDFLAAPTLTITSGLIGAKLGVYPRPKHNWIVIPNLWGANGGTATSYKSPGMKVPLKMLERLAKREEKRYTEACQRHNADLAQNKKDQQDLKRRISLYRKEAKMKMVEKLEKKLAALEKTAALPILHQWSTSSTTREAVIKLMHEQKSHVFLIVRDEFIGHLKAMEKEGHEEDRTFYLQAFDGNSTYSYNTIKHGLLVVPHNCIAMFGTLHPGTFHPYINAAVQGGKGDDGFVQRFQLLVWSAAEPGEEQEREPDKEAAEKAWKVFQYLADLDVNQLLELDLSQDIPGYRFTDKAQIRANKWRKFLKKRLGQKMMNEAFRAHLTKFLALMPSLALLFHLINIAGGAKSGRIPLDCVKMAIGWCKVLESHAHITYNLAQRPEILRAQKLLTALQENPPPKEITYNKAIEKYRSRVGDYHQTKEAFQELINRGYLYLLTMKAANGYQGGGKPSEYLILNPNLAEKIVTHYFQTTKGSSS